MYPPESEEAKAAREKLFQEHEESASNARVKVSRARKWDKIIGKTVK